MNLLRIEIEKILSEEKLMIIKLELKPFIIVME